MRKAAQVECAVQAIGESGIGGVAGDFGEHQEDFCEKYESVEIWGFYRIFQQPEGPKSPVVF